MQPGESPQAVTPQQEAEGLINRTIDEKGGEKSSPEKLQRVITERITLVSVRARYYVSRYVSGMHAAHGMRVEHLGRGVGGQYDGAQEKISTHTLYVTGSIDETLARVLEVSAHEHYHAKNKHLEPIKSFTGDETVRIAGYTFDVRQAIEGLTVHDTGNLFVSGEYQEMERNLVTATRAAGLDMDDIRQAINKKKDFREIDDRTKQPQDSETHHAMAA